MVKKGDTLIEVTIAVGIFSMVAIAIVAVMSGGTSSAQTSLETTLAREEIDSQAEALRFIQASYIAVKSTDPDGTSNFARLWKVITDQAIDLSASGVDKESVLQYAPRSCADLYSGDPSFISTQNAFVINTHAIGDYVNLEASAFDTTENANNAIGRVFVPAASGYLHAASTYPHLIFTKDNSTTNSDNDALATEDFYTNLYRAEGIYIVAVKDNETTSIVSDAAAATASAFYDFYIRTCWYGSNANEPSTISTVIRLYDPAVIKQVDSSSSSPSANASNEFANLPDEEKTMQNVNLPEIINKTANGRGTVLTDERDGSTYQVKKINGSLWMVQNLRYNPGGFDSLASGNGFGDAKLTVASDDIVQGAWYNFCAASNGSNCSSDETYSGVASLCPLKWRLPTIEELSAARTNASFKNFSNPAFYYDGVMHNNSNAGWWSSTPEDGVNQQYFTTSGSSSHAAKRYGFYVRCIYDSSIEAPEPEP